MKRRYLGMMSLAALAMTLGSCQLNEPDTVQKGEVNFRISAGIPDGLTTYAPGAGSGSHLGGASNLKKDEYDLRYVLEVWTDETTPQLAYKATQYEDNFGGVTFDVRLLAMKYKFVFWADFVAEGNRETGLVYDASNLRAIKYATDDRHAGKDEADAYYAVVDVDLTQSGQSIKGVTLKRPFGKIRLVATDALGSSLQTERPETTTVVYGASYQVPGQFDALTGEATAPVAAGSYEFTAYQENAVVNEDTMSGVYILGYDYIFASDGVPSYAFDVTVTGTSGNQIGSRSLSSIPVQANKLTTVIGNFYTNNGSLEVIVDDAFDGNDIKEDVKEDEVIVAGSSSGINEVLASIDPSNAPESMKIAVNEKLDADAVINVPAVNTVIELVLENGAQNIKITGEDFTGNFIIDNNGTESSGNLVIYLPNGDCKIKGGSYSGIDVTTK